MKTIFTISILLLLINQNSFAGQFRSVQSGNYDAVSTWTLFAGADADLKPDFNDTVIVRSGHNVGIASTSGGNAAAWYLDVQSGGVFTGNSRVFSVYTRLIQTGTMVGSLDLQILDNCLFTSSNYTAKGSIRVFYGKTLTIDVGSVINIQGYMEVGLLAPTNSQVINKGTITLNSAGSIIGNLRLTGAGCKWTNDGVSSLTTSKPCTSNATALIDFTSTGSSVTYASTSTYVIPGNYYNLIINSSAAKTLSGNVLVANNLTTNGVSTNSIVLNGKTLTLNGNATLNGFFSSCVINGTDANSKILFNGTTNQTITGTGSFSVQTLEIDNSSSSVTLSNNQNSVHSTLIITNGSFNPNGKLTLVSDASNTARIAPITSGTITSNIVMQKYFPAFAARSFDLSSPSQGSVVMDWDNELYISGIGAYDGIGGQAGVDGDAVVLGSGLAAQSMFTYDEPTAAYAAVTGSNTPLVPGTGYNLWFEDEVNNQWSAKTINTTGIPNQGDVSVNLGYTAGAGIYAGYQLIGNPYASAIDLSLIYDFSNTYYTNMFEFDVEVLDATGNFGYIDAISPGAIIYPHQGFWVLTTAPGANFTFFEGCKVSNVNTAINRTKPANYDIKLMLSTSSSSYYHENTINFNDKSTVNFERPYDMPYRPSPIKAAPALYMLDASNTKIAKNTINSDANDVTFPLGIYTPKTAVYYLDASVLNMDAYKYAWIENVKTGKQFDLNSTAIAIEGEEGQTNTDYVLRLSKTKKSSKLSQTMLESDLVIFNTEGTINLKSNISNHLLKDVTVYDMTGKLILEQSNVNIEIGNITKIDISNFANGVFMVNVIDEIGNSITKKLVK